MTTIDPRQVNIAEKDIENWLWENPQAIQFSTGSKIERWIARQYTLPSGVLDLLGLFYGHLVVVEVKNTTIKPEALTQVCRYAYDLERIASEIGVYHPPNKVIIGKNIETNTLKEAEALEIVIFTFEVNLNLDISGMWGFKSEYYKEQREKIKNLAEEPLFDFLRDELKEHREAEKEFSRLFGDNNNG